MIQRCLPAVLAAAATCGLWSATAGNAAAQCCAPGGPGGPGFPGVAPVCNDCPRFYHYPFYYFPHSYWPSQGPKWPEPPGACYRPPPAYQAFPAFKEPNWRYEYWQPQRYHRGYHFMLDIF